MAKARMGHETLEERLRLSECALEDLATVHGRERIELGGRIGTLTELLQKSRSVTAPLLGCGPGGPGVPGGSVRGVEGGAGESEVGEGGGRGRARA